MIQKAFWTLLILFLQVAGLKLYGMEKEAKITMPAAPLREILATYKETDIPQQRAVIGEVTIEDGGKEKIARSAAELSDIIKEQISDIGIETPIPINMTPTVFNKFVASLKAINTITATDARAYAQALNQELEPILREMSFDDMIDLLYQSNRLDVRPLTWYIMALLSSKLYDSKDMDELSVMIKKINTLFDLRDQMSIILTSLFPNSLVTWKFAIPYSSVAPELYIVPALKMVSNKGIFALTGTELPKFYLWDLTKSLEEPRKQFNLTARPRSFALSANIKKALTASVDNQVLLWDLDSGQIIKRFKETIKHVTAISLSTDSRYALIGEQDGTIHWWDTQSDAVKVLKSHVRSVNALLFNRDNNYVLSGSEDKTAILWDANTSEVVKILSNPDDVLSVAMSSDNKYALTGSTDSVIMWDLTQEEKELKPFKEFKENMSLVTAVAFSHTVEQIITSSSDNMTRLWDIETSKAIGVYQSASELTGKAAVEFSPQDQYALLGFSNGEPFVLWSLSKTHDLPKVVLFIKLNQLGKESVIKNSYFQKLYNQYLRY